jgi:hypothetical protein
MGSRGLVFQPTSPTETLDDPTQISRQNLQTFKPVDQFTGTNPRRIGPKSAGFRRSVLRAERLVSARVC